MEIKHIIDQIEYLTKKLSKLGEEDNDLKKIMLREINFLCLDLIKKIREKEEDRTAERGDRLLKQKRKLEQCDRDKAALQNRYYRILRRARENENTIQELHLKITQLKEKLCEVRSKVRYFDSNGKNPHQELLKAKEKIIADYLAHNKSEEIDLEKRSQLFNW